MVDDPLGRQKRLVAALLAQLRADGAPVDLHETHVSWVLVKGGHAWKIKKALALGFLDFSTLAARRRFCEEEVRLNAALAPGLYLGTVAVTGTPEDPRLGGEGEAIEVTVHMRAFPPEALWSNRIRLGLLGRGEVARFAVLLAGFHARARRAPAGESWGTAQAIAQAGERNMAELAALSGPGTPPTELAELAAWRSDEANRLAACFGQRRRGGAVRECHGDLHCENILTFEGRVMAFDCIEFDDALRWLDVMHDLAFSVMDLLRCGQAGLAARLLNGYLEYTGDYEGLAVLRYYVAECALVRAKVAVLRARSGQLAAPASFADIAGSYLATAREASRPGKPLLVVMHGLSGSGKSTVARRIVELIGAVQVRSDVERKRTPGVEPHCYDRATSRAVYKRLRALAARIATAGFAAVVDAAHLKRSERRACARLAAALGIPWLIVDVRASMDTMRARIERRLAEGADASEADVSVLALQNEWAEPLDVKERAHAIIVDTGEPLDDAPLLAALNALSRR